ncbi:MAG: hypothetical protein ACE5Z5_05710 [Candidatus Bathyarchaeia archaeon]
MSLHFRGVQLAENTPLEAVKKPDVERNPRYIYFVESIAEITGLTVEEVKRGRAARNYKRWLEKLLSQEG